MRASGGRLWIQRCVWLGAWLWGRRRPARVGVEEVLQDHRGGGGVEARLALAPVPLADAQAALGLDAGQALVLDEHRQRRPRPEPGDEGVDVRGLRAPARPSRCSGRPTTMADSPSDSAASWSAVRKTSASGGCAVMTP